MTVSIVIAVKADNPNLRQCIESCLNLAYQDFEILVLPDEDIDLNYPKTTVIPTGSLTPPQKRDIAQDKAKGEIIAFLDDDAYPVRSWLNEALKHFSQTQIAAVGGPAVTPDQDSLMQKASGLVYCNWLVSGPYVYRYIPRIGRKVDDYPSCNFLVRKSVLLEVGGFNTKFWPGEDTFLCLKIVHNLKKEIIYDPDVLVYHHRRSLFFGHFRQIANYAIHRGYFVKRFPENSLKISYFVPSIFVLGLIIGCFGLFFLPLIKIPYFWAGGFYLVVVFFSSLSSDPSAQAAAESHGPLLRVSPYGLYFRLIFLVFWGIIISHIVYGLYFIKGLLSKNLPEEISGLP